MDALHRTLVEQGYLHVATDHLPYFDEIFELLLADPRFEQVETFLPTEAERTDFELIFSDKPIGRCSFRKK
jgi:tRNA G46 methylase TrmB